jgi:hypothetical protein
VSTPDGQTNAGGSTADEAASVDPIVGDPSQAGGPEAFVIPRALAQATLNYLAAQPYREVFALVQGFESLEPLPGPVGRAPDAR